MRPVSPFFWPSNSSTNPRTAFFKGQKALSSISSWGRKGGKNHWHHPFLLVEMKLILLPQEANKKHLPANQNTQSQMLFIFPMFPIMSGVPEIPFRNRVDSFKLSYCWVLTFKVSQKDELHYEWVLFFSWVKLSNCLSGEQNKITVLK